VWLIATLFFYAMAPARFEFSSPSHDAHQGTVRATPFSP